jgi:hypothetical protein
VCVFDVIACGESFWVRFKAGDTHHLGGMSELSSGVLVAGDSEVRVCHGVLGVLLDPRVYLPELIRIWCGIGGGGTSIDRWSSVAWDDSLLLGGGSIRCGNQGFSAYRIT